MKLTGRRVLSLLVCMVLLLTLVPRMEVSVVAAGTCGTNVTWAFSKNGTLTISGHGDMEDYEIYSIRNDQYELVNNTPWSEYQQKIKNIVIENGVKSIGAYAFYECRSLNSVTIAQSVTGIEQCAFHSCSSLKQVTIHQGIVAASAFHSCHSLIKVTLLEGVTSIRGGAFQNCISLRDVVIPKSVTKIVSSAFDGCSNMTSMTFLGSAPTIENVSNDTFFNKGFTATVYHPCNDGTWTDTVKQSMGGNITWVGHVFSDYVPYQDAGCMQNAMATGTCSVCGTTGNVEIPGTATGHSYGDNSLCEGCGGLPEVYCYLYHWGDDDTIGVYADEKYQFSLHYGDTVPKGDYYWSAFPYNPCQTYTFKIDHSPNGWDDWYDFKWDYAFALTAKGDALVVGTVYDYSYGKTFYTIQKTMDHQYGDTVVTPPTDTENGSITHNCIYCGYQQVIEVLHASGHNSQVVVTPPTCTEGGFTTCTCTDCDYNAVFNQTPATGHHYNKTVVSPTCTEGGTTTGVCTVCGHNAVLDTTPATGHHYDATGLCVDCGMQFRLVIYMTDNYGDGWNGAAVEVYTDDTLLTEVTLLEDLLSGKAEVPFVPGKTYQMKWRSGSGDQECGFKISLSGESLTSGQGSSCADGQILCTFETLCAHVYETVVTPPTCTEEGYTTGTCKVCGYSCIVDTTETTGHCYVEGLCTLCGREEAFAGGSCGENLQWHLYDDGRLIISGTGPMMDYSVAEDGDSPDVPWYEHRLLITKVVMEPGVTTVGAYAFHECSNLKEITIPEGVTSIGKLAFYRCNGLQEITLPNGITAIGSAAFRRCSNLTTVTLPEGLVDMGKIAFFDCTALTELAIPKSVTSIGSYSFGGCTGLTKVTFLGATPSMDSSSFTNVTATVFYPCNDKTWAADVRQNYGGALTWEAAHSFGDYIPDQNATCTEDETTTRTCHICGSGESKPLPGTALGHTEEKISATAADCTQTGLTEGVKCAVCDLVLVPQQTIPATGHTEERIPGNAPTCTQTGITEGVRCGVCNEILTPQQVIPLAEHNYDVTTVPVTCTDYGYELYQCQNCNDRFYNRIVEPMGHNYENHTCIRCGETDPVVWDLSGDGTVTVVDVAMLYAYVMGTLSLDTSTLAHADVNGDGSVDIGDTARLYAHVKGTNP